MSRNDDTPKRNSMFESQGILAGVSGLEDEHKSQNVSKTQTETDRLDLSLGQELAGGGFGGKRAKLGKLIIEDEGQKMIDLLVAANMALWWKAYDKSDPIYQI